MDAATVLTILASAGLTGVVVWLVARRQPIAAPPQQDIGAAVREAMVPQQMEVGNALALTRQAFEKLTSEFEALSSKALRSSSEQFLSLADTKLQARQKEIEALLGPMREQLADYGRKVEAIEKSRQEAYGSLSGLLRDSQQAQEALRKETSLLVGALRSSKTRGQWGEITLRRVVETSGMSKYIDFVEQENLTVDDRRFIPDLTVRLPGGGNIVVDAKAVLDAYLDSVNAGDEAQRKSALVRHAGQVRSRFVDLSRKEYWKKLHSPEFVVLFLPGEAFYHAAVEHDERLIEDALAANVILASPMSLMALLRTIALGWRQEEQAANARKIAETAGTLMERFATFAKYYNEVGKKLNDAVGAYNQSVSSAESRLLPAARKIAEMGIGKPDDIKDVSAVDAAARSFAPLAESKTDTKEST